MNEPIVEKIIRLHNKVWEFRRRMERDSNWATPPLDDSLKFAVTEAAEALDAELRQNPIYARNNHKDEKVEAELADCSIMLLTAVVPTKLDSFLSGRTYDPAGVTLTFIVKHVAEAAMRTSWRDSQYWEDEVMLSLCAICAYVPDIEMWVDTRIKRLLRKHSRVE